MYVVDTSSWIDLYRFYPQTVFVGLWSKIKGLIDGKMIAVPVQVQDEILHQDDGLARWFDKHAQKCVRDEYNMNIVGKVAANNQEWLTADAKDAPADPFVVAPALSMNGIAAAYIITQESPKSGNRIPQVAKEYGIESMSLIGLFKKECWRF